jgi:hypothetical protein
MRLRIVLALTALAFALPARAQVTIIRSTSSSGSEITIEGGDEEIVQDAPAPEVQEATPSKKASGPRLDKLKRLDFDRRASAILAAWANPPRPKGEEKDKSETDAAAPEKTADASAPAADKPATGDAAATSAKPADATPETPEAAEKRKAAEEAARKKAEEEAAKKATASLKQQ